MDSDKTQDIKEPDNEKAEGLLKIALLKPNNQFALTIPKRKYAPLDTYFR